MNDDNASLETTLRRLKFTPPSENYSKVGTSLIRQSLRDTGYWNARLGIAVSALLLLSVGINLFQVSTRGYEESASTALTSSIELQASDISGVDSIFRFLCFTKSSVLASNPIALSELKGFGEWLYFQTADDLAVTVSLLPLREWKAIGEFEDGVVSLELGEDRALALHGVGIGPSSLKRGGPFPVYGAVEQLTAARGQEALRNPAAAPAANSFTDTYNQAIPAIRNVIAGVDSPLSPLTEKYFGALLKSGECG